MSGYFSEALWLVEDEYYLVTGRTFIEDRFDAPERKTLAQSMARKTQSGFNLRNSAHGSLNTQSKARTRYRRIGHCSALKTW